MKKVEFFAKDIENKSVKIDTPLGIEVRFNGCKYRISESNTGELLLYATAKTQLILKPKSGNLVEIDSCH